MALKLDKVIGHRGACGYTPENTLASMSKAYELGAKWVEFDVMLAQSGEPIVMHDLTLNRTTNGRGEVAKADFNTLATLDCGSWFSKTYANEKVPSLAALLQHIAPLDMGINVEIKPPVGVEELTVSKTLETLALHWPAYCKPPLVSSFSFSVLQALHQAETSHSLGYIIDRWVRGWESILDQFNCTSLHVDYRILTPKLIRKIKNLGYFVLAYTVNDVKRARQLFQWGIDCVFTDYPDLILKEKKLWQ